MRFMRKKPPGEIMRADPALRRRADILCAVLALLCLLGSVLLINYGSPIDTWQDEFAKHVAELQKTDPIAAQEAIDDKARSLLAALWSLGAATLAGCLWYGRKFWKAEQWPPAGARLIFDQPVVRGRPLRMLAAFFFGFGIFVFCAFSYATWRLSSMLL